MYASRRALACLLLERPHCTKMSFDLARNKKYANIRNGLDDGVLLPSLPSSVVRQHPCSCVCLTTCLFVCFPVFHGSVNCCHKVEVLSVSFTARDHSPVAGLLYCFVCVVWLIAFLLLVSLTTFSFASFQQIKRKRKKITVSFWVAFQSTFFLLKRH
jgi:hypothetical protein